MLLLRSLALLALLSPLVLAQVAVPGRHAPLGATVMIPAGIAVNDDGARVARYSAVPFFELPFQDNDLLTMEDRAERTRSAALTQQSLPFKFGQAVPALVDFMAEAAEVILPSGDRVLRWGVRSAGALSMSVLFDKFRLPQGAEFFVYNEHQTLGAFTAEVNNKEHLEFSTSPIRGDYLLLEYFEPAGLVRNVEPLIVLSDVVHGFKAGIFEAASGACNINVACKNWGPETRAVGMLLTDKNQRYCTGALVNNAKNDGRQLFLTANHCMTSSPAKHIILFNHEYATCTGSTTAPITDTVQGLTILSQYSSSDFALLEVQERIPDAYNVYLAGFSAEEKAPVNPVAVHHPSGDVKKISFFNGTAKDTCWSECPKTLHWQIPAWTQGTTEPGSSGSPLFDGVTHRIVGQLHGGTAACSVPSGYDSYGKVAASWATATATTQRLKDFLDPASTGVNTVAGIDLKVARANSGL